MSSVTNETRAQWAAEALKAFRRETGQSLDDPESREEVLGDILCDLRHWCDHQEPPVDFKRASWRGKSHYRAEKTGRE